MNEGEEDDGIGIRRPGRKTFPPSKRSIILLFAVGAILLVSPIILTYVWTPDPSCSSVQSSSCSSHNELYNRTISFLPFIMVVGGVVIAFNMKRISDALRPEEP